MPIAHESVVFDVDDAKVYSLTSDTGASPAYGAAVDVPGIAEVSLQPNFVTALLKGDAKIMARKGRIDQINISATYGKISGSVLAVVLGTTVVDAGSTPNQTATVKLKGANSLAYFKFAFRISDVDLGLGDVTVVLYKAQLTGGTLLGGKSDEFGQPTLDISGIALDSSDDIVDIIFHETRTALAS